jgi:Uma2 family endonuclease
MSAVAQYELLVPSANYFAAEEASPIKHEYLSGVVYAMAGGTPRHGAIATNIAIALGQALRGSSCRPYNSDVLVHLRHGTDERFYYPDVSVACEPVPVGARAIENPTIIFEVLSPSTERLDRSEKRDAYLRCPSLKAFVLVASENVEVTIYERAGEEWKATVYTDQADILPLSSLTCELPLSEIYRE